MEVLEFILIVLACVIISAVLGKLIRGLALPLIQIIVGFLVAMAAPAIVDVQVSSELFLVLFIAPLLFNEARKADKRSLWNNKWAIISLAIGLVIVSVFVVGIALNQLVPTIPLAAAFACAAALGPTDAAAVSAMGSTVRLRERQDALLSGESLVNDASGVVTFQFALAAALTGSFSLIDAGERFAILFFGGLLLGAAAGAVALFTMRALRHFGYEDTTIHVLYEVFTPFVVYLLAEWAHVSGILAVVAAGLVMAERAPRLISTTAARQQMVSDNFWKIIVFLINGAIFIMLGMQLPQALTPEMSDHFSITTLLGIVAAISVLLLLCRLIWIFIMELIHKDSASGKRGSKGLRGSFRDALIMTLAGPKGAVTLSIIFTIPMTLANGSTFPDRSAILFITACTILVTLLAANFLLPLLAPKPKRSDESAIRHATIKVLEATSIELQKKLDEGSAPEYIPALRATLARYETRLARERESTETCGPMIGELSAEVLGRQQQRADELQHTEINGLTVAQSIPYYTALRRIRTSLGYRGAAAKVGSRYHSLQGRMLLLGRLIRDSIQTDLESEQIYYDSCIFAIELEHVALDYLNGIAALDDARKPAAKVLIKSHELALESLWGRINYGQETPQEDRNALELGPHHELPPGMKGNFSEQIAKMRTYADEVDANALIAELDAIRHLEEAGEITESVAYELRQRVYALQMALT